jgi:hypothetical protein
MVRQTMLRAGTNGSAMVSIERNPASNENLLCQNSRYFRSNSERDLNSRSAEAVCLGRNQWRPAFGSKPEVE